MLVIVPIVFYFGGAYVAVASLVVLLLLLTSLYRYSPKILLRWYRCHEAEPATQQGMHDMMASVASEFAIPCPKIYLFDASIPMLFSVGTRKAYSVVISESALNILDEDELRALLACEVAKISIGSVPVNTFVGLIAGSIMSLSTVAMWMSMLAGFGQEKDAAPRFARFLAMGLVSLPAALVVHIFGVNSTLKADDMAASAITDGSLLCRALYRANNYIRLHCTEDFNPGHVNLFLVNPLRLNDIFDLYSSMFIIKPDIGQRVSLIKEKYGRDGQR
ncbi:MAG: M48 family metalloprotease [Methanolobus sp.]|nr:M48 family metalloprotease [Methanolobus sp.]